MLRVALVGQPNSGKSTLFNAIVGYRAVASNFPGTTVEVLKGKALVGGKPAEVVDLPGIYSLHAGDPAERLARDYLLSGQVDVVVNVVDASLLGRSLELTLELAELGLPLVVCLNMMDEAHRKGIHVDSERLSEVLGAPVVESIAVRGVGLKELLAAIPQAKVPTPPRYAADVEEILTRLAAVLASRETRLPPRYLAEVLLAGEDLPEEVGDGELTEAVEIARREFVSRRGQDPALVLSAERHALALGIFEEVARVTHAAASLRDRVDSLLMHRVWGYPIMLAVLLALFFGVFKLGGVLEGYLLPPLDALTAAVEGAFPGPIGKVLGGALQGLWAGIGIVLPYLVPFLFFLAFLEDVGYLPRVGFLLDGLMHRIGLHGKSVIPFLLGYGCSVPAVLATRILEEERDRLVTAALAVMIPCAARTVVIFGIVGRYVGPWIAFSLYLLNILVVAAAGTLLRKLLPGIGPGLIMEIPPYRLPTLRTMLLKVWLRLRGFITVAWPTLIVASAFFSLIEALGWTRFLNTLALPITWPLGLPATVGVPLVFGILRKELSLIMLGQALGTMDFGAALSGREMVVFTVFVIFYVPCIATVAALWRELGHRKTLLVVAGTVGVALVIGLIVRGFSCLFGIGTC
ncbi:ferrous iron transport protein B [Candidatus Bipolaricaulota bacterium]|nr:ferrous iron transport protein B [Candidatus Bipolaricaulota bacterium]